MTQRYIIVTNNKGELVATQQAAPDQRGMEAGLMAGPGQKLHEVDVPDELAEIRDAAELHQKIAPYIPKR
jgi:hypothetical protein